MARTRTIGLMVVALLAVLSSAALSAGGRSAAAGGRAWRNQLFLADLHGMFCLGASTCWVAGNNQTAPVVFHTTNGGLSWQVQTPPVTAGTINSVYCQADGLHCWLAGQVGQSGAIFGTTDGGSTWATKLITTSVSYLNGIACPLSPTGTTCIAVGDLETQSATFWTGEVLLAPGDLSTVRSVVTAPGSIATLTGIACRDSGHCAASGTQSTDQSTGVYTAAVISTDSGGQRWRSVSVPPGITDLAAVACVANGTCWAAGYAAPGGASPSGTLVSGNINATSWTIEVHPPGVDYLDTVACADAAHCLAGGYGGVGVSATAQIAFTTDGSSWSSQNVGAGYLDGVACPSTRACWASGYQALGSPASGTFSGLRLPMGGGLWTVQPRLTLPARVALAGLSCPDSTHCVAVGNSASGAAVLATADGATWQLQTTPGPPGGTLYHLDAVACPDRNHCVAVGYQLANGRGGVLAESALSMASTDGATWTGPTIASVANHFDGVTCTDLKHCWAAGAKLIDLASNSTLGVIAASPSLGMAGWSAALVAGTVGYLSGVSCAPGSTTCAAAGTTTGGTGTVVTTTDGTNWNAQSLPALPNGGILSDLTAVACPTVSQCWAVGDQLIQTAPGQETENQAVILAGMGNSLSTWMLQSAPANSGPLVGLACPTATSCESVGVALSSKSSIAISTSGGGTWNTDNLPTDTPGLRAVACAAATTSCRAAGTSLIIAAGS